MTPPCLRWWPSTDLGEECIFYVLGNAVSPKFVLCGSMCSPTSVGGKLVDQTMHKTGFVPNISRANMIHICVLQGAMVSTDSRCAYTDNCRCIVYSDKRNSAAGKSFSLMSCSA